MRCSLVFAGFVRQVHAHVYQDGFEYSIERGNPAANQRPSVRTKQMVPTVRRHVGVDEVHTTVDRVLARYAYDEHATASEFARKVLPGAAKLLETMDALEVFRKQEQRAAAKDEGEAG